MRKFFAFLLLSLCLIPSPGRCQEAPRFTSSNLWLSGFAASQKIPLVGDVDGDGRADLLSLSRTDAGLNLARTSSFAKPYFPGLVASRMGTGILAAVCAPFKQPDRSDVLTLCADGSLHLAHSYQSAARVCTEETVPLVLPASQIPKPPLFCVAADFDGDSKTDWLILDSLGRITLFQNQTGLDGVLKFSVRMIAAKLSRVRQLSAGDFNGDGRSELVCLNADGLLSRSRLKFAGKEVSLSAGIKVAVASPDNKLVVGRFSGTKEADILIGQRLLIGGSPSLEIRQPKLPTNREAISDAVWLAGDIDGDGKDDLIRVRRSDEPSIGDDILIHYSRTNDAPAWNACQMNDGLPDVWKSGKVLPGGLNLRAMGCSTGHRDVIVEVQRVADVPEATVKREIDKAVKYFANLPIENPDRQKGIALHVLYRESIPLNQKDLSWWKLGEKYHAASHRGVTHWMLVTNGGGGQSSDMSDRGSCGVQALYATFLHELGHQLGLDHTGRWGPVWCPTYPSLMNYAYNYQLEGSFDKIGYSDGRLAKVILNESRLSERLPIQMDKIAFLSGPPYYYRMKPSEDGQSTLIDWNWNGVFGEENLAADINYGYSTQAGERQTLGKTYTAPVLASLGEGKTEKLLLFCGLLPAIAPLPAASAEVKLPSLSLAQPGRLILRIWQGDNPATEGGKWSPEIEVEGSDVIGDASACSFQGAAWVSYPTTTGIAVRRIEIDSLGKPVIGAKFLIEDSKGALPSLSALGAQLALILWRSDSALLGFRLLSVSPTSLKPERERILPCNSVFPPGVAEGEASGGEPSLWLGIALNQIGRGRSRWQARRFALKSELEQVSSEWIGGEQGTEHGSGRIMLLYQKSLVPGKEGRLNYYQCGAFGSSTPWACHYVATRIADKSVHGGWLVKRFYDEWTQSRSAPGVCFFRGDIAFALRWFGNVRASENDNCMVGFFGRGIESQPMGDFDDISFIRDVGLSHSILCVGE